MACFVTTATSSDCYLNAVFLSLKNKPLFHISSLFHIICFYLILFSIFVRAITFYIQSGSCTFECRVLLKILRGVSSQRSELKEKILETTRVIFMKLCTYLKDINENSVCACVRARARARVCVCVCIFLVFRLYPHN